MTESSQTSPTQDVIEQAARWAAMLDAGDMSDEDREACEAWCAEHPLHRRTLDRMRAFDARVENVEDFERDALRTVLERRSSRYRRAGGALFAIALLAITGWVGMRSDYVRDRFPDYQTGRGEFQTVALVDRSEITIDTDGAVRVDIEDDRRQVRLIRGQILAKVAKDQARPFVVRTVHGTATALGTAFVVRREDSDTLVTVIESRVRVCPEKATTDETGCRVLVAGERALITPSRISLLAPVDPTVAAMWSSGWLEADDEEVAEVLAELNRYREKPIRFDAASLRGLKVTGSFPLRDIDRAIDGVGRTARLDVRHADNGEVVISRRR